MAVLRTLLVSLILLVAGIGILAGATDRFRAYTTETARRIGIREHTPVIPPLPLQMADGGHTSFGQLRGRWLLVDFIYTRCMTYCSVQGSEFARLQQQLVGPIESGQLALLSVSFDPVHDDPAALAGYQRRHGNHGAGWIAARPVDHADLVALMRVLDEAATRQNGRVREILKCSLTPRFRGKFQQELMRLPDHETST